MSDDRVRDDRVHDDRVRDDRVRDDRVHDDRVHDDRVHDDRVRDDRVRDDPVHDDTASDNTASDNTASDNTASDNTASDNTASAEAGLAAVAARLGPAARPRAPLGSLTTYRVGGPAALLFTAENEDDLQRARHALTDAGTPVPVLVLGRGSNVLVADAGFPGLVVRLGRGFETVERRPGDVVRAGGACDLPVLARRTVQWGLTGLEWAVGVPGSVGGAVRMNAGGHGADTATRLLRCRRFDLASARQGEIDAAGLGFGYRSSVVGPAEVVVWGEFALAPGDPATGRAALTEIVRWRRAHQPGGSNAGSVFANPPGDAAGRLVEAAGLKGHRLGTARVSEKHANFIQADDGGAADDVARLIALVRRRVAARFGVRLETEVRLIGFGSDETGPEDPEMPRP